MTACDECGRPLDPDTACPHHRPGCSRQWCDCPTLCASCCQDTSCPLAQIPGQLTIDETT